MDIEGYKLFRLRKDGTLGTLFVDRSLVIPVDEWMPAKDLSVMAQSLGLKARPGWHATLTPYAPHLKLNLASGEKRVWVNVALRDTTLYDKPESQGGTWVLANELKVLNVLQPGMV